MPEETKTLENNTQSGNEDSTALLKALTDRMVNDKSVTSQETGIQKSVNQAIAGVKSAQESTGQRIESQFGREKDFGITQANAQRTAGLEQRAGGATQQVALKLSEESTIKYVNDLETRKQDALLANDAQAAQQIAGMQLQALQFQQDAKQNYISNLMGLTGLAQKGEFEQRQASQFTQNLQLQRDQMDVADQRRIAELASTYGVTMEEGETLQSITAKIAPLVSNERAAELRATNRKYLETQESDTESLEFDGFIDQMFTADPNLDPSMALAQASDYFNSIGVKMDEAKLAKLQRRISEIGSIKQLEQQVGQLQAQQRIADVDRINQQASDSKVETPGSVANSTPATRGVPTSIFGQQTDEATSAFFSSLF